VVLKTPGDEVRSAINAEAAWDRAPGTPNVVVAVIDTGIRPEHPDCAPTCCPATT
jgi:serine protease